MARQFLTPVGLPTGSALPSAGATGNLFYLTTDNLVYQHNGTAWTGLAQLSGGNSLTGQQLIVSSSTTATGLVVRAITSQTATLLEIQDSSSNLLVGVTSAGNLNVPGQVRVGTTSGLAQLSVVSTNAATIAQVVRGAASQSANLQEWQDGSSTTVANMSPTGQLHLGANTVRGSQTVAINTHTPTGTTNISITTASAHGVTPGQRVTIAGVTPSGYNGSYTAESGTTGSTLVVYIGSNPGAITTGGTLTQSPRLGVTALSAQNVPLIVRAAASQVNHLQQWQDASGAVLARIDGVTGQFQAPSIVSSNFQMTASGVLSVGTSAAIANTQAYILSTTATNVGLTVRGAASQTADLQQWQSSASTVLASTSSSGNFLTNTFVGTQANANVFGMLYGASGTPSAYAEGSLSTNAGFSTPVMLPNEEGYYPYWGFKTPNVVETSADGTTWTVVDPTAYRSLFAFQNGSSISVTTRFLRVTHYQPTFTFLALVSARFVGGTNSKPVTMKTELLNSDYSTVNSTYGPTAGVVGYDGAALMQKFNSYNGSTYATRVTFDMALWAAGDSYQIGSVMAYMSKPGTGFGFQNKFPMLWDVNRTATFRPSQPGATGLIVQAAVTATSTITAATANGTTVTYTTSAQHGFLAGFAVSITGVVSTGNPGATAGSGFNLTGATIAAVLSQTQFTVTNALVDTYTSGGTLSVAQTADLQQWRNAAGTAVARVSSVGDLVISGIGITSGDHRVGTATYFSAALNVQARAATEKGQVIRGFASQSASMLELQNSAGTITANFTAPVNNVNRLNLGGTDLSATLGITVHASGGVGQVIRGAASQSANLQEWQDSSGGAVAVLTPTGTFRSAGLISAGDAVNVLGQLSVTSTAASRIGAVIRGAVSQTADLQQWQSWDGTTPTTLGSMNNTGRLSAVAISSNSTQFYAGDENSGAYVRLTRQTAGAAAPGANMNKLYLRDGTTTGVRLVAIAGASGVEETLIDNINTNGTASSLLAVKYIDGGSA